MASIEKSLPLLYELEFSNDPARFLHKNKGEEGYTLGGVYQKANKLDIDWELVEKIHEVTGAITRASTMLYNDYMIQDQVTNVFRNKYWNKLNLDGVENQKIADEIFLMGVVSGVRTSAKIAQGIIGVEQDGIIGKETLKYLNRFDPVAFDVEFDKREVRHFENLAQNNPKFNRYLKGWKMRANFC